MDQNIVDEIVRLYKEKPYIQHVRRSTGLADYHIIRCLRLSGVVIRPGRKRDPRVARALQMYTDGMSAPEVAQALDARAETVRQWVIKWGSGTRSLSDAHKARPATFNEHVFDILTPASSYWLGMCLGDSWINRDDTKGLWRLNLGLAARDRGHIEKFKQFLGTPNKIVERTGVRKGNTFYGCTISVSSKHLIDKVAEYYIVPNKTFNTRLHEDLRYNRDAVRGLIDSDGYVSQTASGKPLLGVVGDYDVCDGFRDYVKTIVPTKASVTRHGNIFRFAISCDMAKKVLRQLYQPGDEYYLDRKMWRALAYTGRLPQTS